MKDQNDYQKLAEQALQLWQHYLKEWSTRDHAELANLIPWLSWFNGAGFANEPFQAKNKHGSATTAANPGTTAAAAMDAGGYAALSELALRLAVLEHDVERIKQQLSVSKPVRKPAANKPTKKSSGKSGTSRRRR